MHRPLPSWLDASWREFRHALRSLLRRPGFTLIALASLALGIGANSAIFSVVDAVYLKPLPLPGGDRVVAIQDRQLGQIRGGNPSRVADLATAQSFDAVAALYGEGLIVKGAADPQRLTIGRVMGDLPGVLGVPPLIGRTFTPAELHGAGAPAVILTHKLWRAKFNSSPNILNQSLITTTGAYHIIGVLPDVPFPDDIDVWGPIPNLQTMGRKAAFLAVVARLKSGVSRDAANVELAGISARLAKAFPDSDGSVISRAVPVPDVIAGDARLPILVLFATLAFVLLIACANLASLLLARGVERQREAAIRAAVGAGRWSVIRLFLIESLLLALAGAGLGLSVAAIFLEFLKTAVPLEIARLQTASLDARVVLFSLALALFCGLLFGLIPAWQASRGSYAQTMRDGGSATPRPWLRRILVVGQVALSLTLLIGTALLSKSFLDLRTRPLGFQPALVGEMEIDFSWDTSGDTIASFSRRLLTELRSTPGVRAAGLADRLPLQGPSQTRRELQVQGSPIDTKDEYGLRQVDRGYFQTIGVPLVAGRMWPESTPSLNRQETVINQAFARKYFPDKNALGSHIAFSTGREKTNWYEVVGIVADVRRSNSEPEPAPEAFVDILQGGWPQLRFVVLSQGDKRSVANAMRAAVRLIDPNMVIGRLGFMQQRVGESYREPKLVVGLMAAFSLTALVLALIGLYGLMSSEVAARTQEIGVRMAVGADEDEVLWMVLRRGLLLTTMGLTAGIAGGLALGRVLSSLVPGISPVDVFSLLATVGVFLICAAIACHIPARRAAMLDPLQALRHE